MGKADQNIVYDGTNLNLNGFSAITSVNVTGGTVFDDTTSGSPFAMFHLGDPIDVLTFTALATKVLFTGYTTSQIFLSATGTPILVSESYFFNLFNNTTGVSASNGPPYLADGHWDRTAIIAKNRNGQSFAWTPNVALVPGNSYTLRLIPNILQALHTSSGADASVLEKWYLAAAAQVIQLRI